MSSQAEQRVASGQEQCMPVGGEQAGSDAEKGLLRQAAETVGLMGSEDDEVAAKDEKGATHP